MRRSGACFPSDRTHHKVHYRAFADCCAEREGVYLICDDDPNHEHDGSEPSHVTAPIPDDPSEALFRDEAT